MDTSPQMVKSPMTILIYWLFHMWVKYQLPKYTTLFTPLITKYETYVNKFKFNILEFLITNSQTDSISIL